MPSTDYVAWWNVENLFDGENSPRRTDKLKRVLVDSIVGWTPALRDRKIDQLTSVAAQMNAGVAPDVLGILRGREQVRRPALGGPDQRATPCTRLRGRARGYARRAWDRRGLSL